MRDVRPLPRLPALALPVGLCVVLLAACEKAEPLANYPANTVTRMQAGLDMSHPGRGPTDFGSNTPADVPTAYAMVLLAEVERGRLSIPGEVPEPGPVAGTWLLEHADENRDGVIGWGLPIAWDAYGDGSVNPADTEYAISTGIVVHALLEWLGASGKAPRERILSAVGQALAPYLDRAMWSPAGMLPYSLRASDRKYDTFNSAAYLAGQMQRFSKVTGDASLASKLQVAADSTMQALLANRQVTPDGNAWYWNYSIQELSPNDLAHAGFIIDGVNAYMASGGQLSSRFERAKVVANLLQFLESGGAVVRAWPRSKGGTNAPARLVDLGVALHITCKEPTLAMLRGALLTQMQGHVGGDGHYMKYPRSSGLPNLAVAEYEAYLFRGLASCAAAAIPAK